MEYNFGQVWVGEARVHKKSPRRLTIPVKVEGQSAQALIDSGCEQSFIQKKITDAAEKPKEDRSLFRCIHGDIAPYPSRIVRLTVKRHQYQLRACVSLDLPYPVILGLDWPYFSELLRTLPPPM